MKYWNSSVSNWLKHYVQLRLIEPGQKSGFTATFLTFCMSGLWHGFYPMYWVGFLMAGIFQELCKDIFRARRLFDFIPAPLSTIIVWILA